MNERKAKIPESRSPVVPEFQIFFNEIYVEELTFLMIGVFFYQGQQLQIAKSQLKYSLNLHFICTKKVLIGCHICCFFDVLVLMFLTKLNLNDTIIKCNFGIDFLNYDPKFPQNIMHICPK